MTRAGMLLFERYRLVRELGAGGMGVVWLATDEVLELPVALKHLSGGHSLREARLAAQLRGEPHVVTLYDVHTSGDDGWLVMEYRPSLSLAQLITEHGRLAAGEVAEIGVGVAGALAAAHALGIRHRDVSPGNVLLGADGRAKLTDFGIAERVALAGRGLAGTPAYLAPEVLAGEASGASADVFSLGATLCAAVTGVPPIGTTVPTTGATELTRLLDGLLAADPGARPSAAAVAEALTPLATGIRPGTVELVRRGSIRPRQPWSEPTTPPDAVTLRGARRAGRGDR